LRALHHLVERLEDEPLPAFHADRVELDGDDIIEDVDDEARQLVAFSMDQPIAAGEEPWGAPGRPMSRRRSSARATGR